MQFDLAHCYRRNAYFILSFLVLSISSCLPELKATGDNQPSPRCNGITAFSPRLRLRPRNQLSAPEPIPGYSGSHVFTCRYSARRWFNAIIRNVYSAAAIFLRTRLEIYFYSANMSAMEANRAAFRDREFASVEKQ